MSRRPAIGGYIYREYINSGRLSTDTARKALKRILEEEPGPQTRAMLIAEAALSLAEILKVFAELEEIARPKNGKDEQG